MKTRCYIIIAIIVLVAAVAIYLIVRQPTALAPANNQFQASLTAQEALTIAKASACAGDGAVQEESFYNSNSKTWWFTLKADKAGCNPACVVSEETRSAETNWRCTGLILPDDPAKEKIEALFKEKYPKYKETLFVTISKETADHARGAITFVAGEAGGIFLAAKINGQWQLVFDGNGAINCALSSYGFPAEMLADCAR